MDANVIAYVDWLGTGVPDDYELFHRLTCESRNGLETEQRFPAILFRHLIQERAVSAEIKIDHVCVPVSGVHEVSSAHRIPKVPVFVHCHEWWQAGRRQILEWDEQHRGRRPVPPRAGERKQRDHQADYRHSDCYPCLRRQPQEHRPCQVHTHLFFLPSLSERFGLCDYKPIAAEEGPHFQAREHAMRQLLMEISVAGACLSAFAGLYWLAVAFGIAAMAAGRIEDR